MIKYTISLKLKGSQNPNEEYQYTLSLTSYQENNPDKIFTSEIRESMRTNLQNQSSCKISDSHLNQMIKSWIEDIKEGYRSCPITLDLPPLIAEKINQLQEAGNQEMPTPIYPDLSEIAPCWGMLPPLNFC
ncbi:hypothetical protein IQ270_28995 [Microcoleus sp. LEGE 07076]|uniref:hypothetical protein n=1 Tax=Microcoleus sp. LEGE 07076 TaxID=915322 RepID=UPI00187E09BE|nr:hypothetical protein [Microcoleus sp. LEGE 07076]MBE9188563.1 hypothetical protein [Microcoleus sp. LEGE 07076]